ncbi:MAG: metal-dependent transcriptional regulator [Aerococcus sp.]|nr:metal-dependent transcriptional regulator [Aerococcus sp.]
MVAMSRSKDDYMKAIAELGGITDCVSNKAISDSLSVSAASVSEMINRLQREGLVKNTPYQGVSLTPAGRSFAALVIRRHRIWEVFLYNKLGYSWEEVHEEAEDLEHHASGAFIDRMEAYLDFPKYCPHGGLIPAKDGAMPDMVNYRLSGLDEGEYFQLRRVTDQREFLESIDALHLKLEETYQLLEKKEDELSIRHGDKTYTLSRQLADHLYINPIKGPRD